RLVTPYLTVHGNQLWIDLNATSVRIPARPFHGVSGAPVTSVTAFNVDSGRARIIVEVSGKADYAIGQRRNQRILALAKADGVPNLAASLTARRPAPKLASAQPRKATAPLASASHATDAEPRIAGHPVVMIDPGHGGFDPGTTSSSGLQEKDLALAISRRVASALSHDGVSV